jgi:hypothetical protein
MNAKLEDQDLETRFERIPDNAYADEPRNRARPESRTDPAPALGARSLIGIDFAEMQPHLKDGYMVKGLITPNSLVGIIGATGSGKTFLATDLAMHIAAGRRWRARNVRRGLVVYAALEGPVSAENRFVAARDRGGFERGIPLRLTPGPINLRDAGDVALLIAFVKEAESAHGEKCAAIFVDTLSRALAGGDENGPEDMGALIAGADAVRLATGAVLVLVHHLGKDVERGARGHSSLKAALDTEIEVSVRAGKIHVAAVTKQRDLPSGDQFPFKLASVELGKDEDGDAVTSCIVEVIDEVPTDRKQPRGKNQARLLAALQEWRRNNPDRDFITTIDYRGIAKAQGLVDRNRLQEATEGLERFGWLHPLSGGYRFAEEQKP